MMGQDNQQETLDCEIAWIAGALCCDGTVCLSCHRRNDQSKPKIGVTLTWYNTDSGIITKVIDVLEKLNLGYYITERKQRKMHLDGGLKYGNTDIGMITVNVKKFKDAYCLSKLLQPWMFGEKQHRLNLVIQYLARRLEKIEQNDGNFRNVLLDDGDINIVADFYRRFVKRNKNNTRMIERPLNDYT